ncbi:MAG: HAMP domain-containing sensor histidine kinase [Micrococcus sp.]|nr:HAMP domain-containing sensor histidine kinase [Micrococcus sp.]
MSSSARAAARPRRRVSLAVRTAAGVVVLLAVVLSVFTLTSLAFTGRTVDAQLEQSVEQAWDRTYGFLWRGRVDHPDFAGRNPLGASGQPEGLLVLVTAGGQVFQASRLDADEDAVDLAAQDVQTLAALAEETVRQQEAQDARLAELPEEEAEAVDDVRLIRTLGLQEGRFLVLSETVDDDDGVAVVGLPTKPVDTTKAQLARVQVLGSLAALVLAGLLGWWWIRRSLRPLGEVSQAAARVADVPMGSGEVSLERYRVRRELAQPVNEVGDVGFALNRLIDSVDGAIEQRNRSEQRLRTFVADASHELRTPLASVRGYAEMVRLTEPLTDRGQDALGRVLQQSDRMGSLVEDLLLLARLDAGREHRRGEVDLGEVVVDAVMDATAAGQDHNWTVDVPEEPVTVLGDRQQLAQLVANLLSNARKHTPDGTTVQVRLEEESPAGAGTVRLTVLDDGPGIEPRLVSGLFDRFVRGDTARTTREGSTGLGLSIVRSVARAHGGDATVESGPGRTVFAVDLPASGAPGGTGQA